MCRLSCEALGVDREETRRGPGPLLPRSLGLGADNSTAALQLSLAHRAEDSRHLASPGGLEAARVLAAQGRRGGAVRASAAEVDLGDGLEVSTSRRLEADQVRALRARQLADDGVPSRLRHACLDSAGIDGREPRSELRLYAERHPGEVALRRVE